MEYIPPSKYALRVLESGKAKPVTSNHSQSAMDLGMPDITVRTSSMPDDSWAVTAHIVASFVKYN